MIWTRLRSVTNCLVGSAGCPFRGHPLFNLFSSTLDLGSAGSPYRGHPLFNLFSSTLDLGSAGSPFRGHPSFNLFSSTLNLGLQRTYMKIKDVNIYG